MIIGFDGSRAFVNKRSGTENYSFQLLKALSKIDHKNIYKIYLRSQGLTSRGWPDNFQFLSLNFPYLWTQVGLALQTFKDKLDVLFVPAHTLPIIRKPGLKTVITVHDLGSEYLPQMHQLKQRFYLSFMQRVQLQGATKIIAVSQATKDDLVKKIGINPQKIAIVYEGYDKKLFKPVTSNMKHGDYFLFVGTVQPRKNLERLIVVYHMFAARHGTKNRSISKSSSFSNSLVSLEARKLSGDHTTSSPHFSIARDFAVPSLIIVGSRGWLSDEIYTLPKKLGIEDKVKFLGYVPDEKLPVLYSGAIALVFPSLFEGFGLPILEAQACGCPVVTSNISSMSEVAGKGAMLVNPYDIDDIVKSMERVQGTGYRLQLIKKGYENVKRFSWEKCARETLEVLES